MSSNNKFAITNEAEMNVLSIAFHSIASCDQIFTQLVEQDFVDSRHRIIFAGIKRLYDTTSAINLTTISNELLKGNKIGQVGGIEYLTEIFESYVSEANLDDYLAIIINSSTTRQLEFVLGDLKKEIQVNAPIRDVLSKAERDILSINYERKANSFKTVGIELSDVLKKIEMLGNSDDTITGTRTGFIELDKMTSGLQKGDFIILAARPSMGKTALALNFCINSALFKSKPSTVVMFSLEMPTEQLIQRMIGSISTTESMKIRSGKGITPDDWKRITNAADQLKKTNIYIDDTPGLRIIELQSKLRKLVREQQLNLVVIDYLQLLTTSGSYVESRQQEVSTISRQLKALARELNVPIVCLSQLSRSVEKREEKRPIMSDLRDSGAIEQDADLIMFLYREDYYERKEFTDGQKAEIILAKHRNGPTGSIKLLFAQKYGSFENLN